MDPSQVGSLQQYLDMRSQEHASQHKALMDIGQNTASLLASQLKAAEERQILTDLAEKVKTADGTCPNSTRLWIKNIDRAATHTKNQVTITKLVRKIIQGPLEFAVESFLTEKTVLNVELCHDDIPWNIIKPYVRDTFLPHNETELLRQKLSTVQQGTNEDLYSYKLRFLEAAEDAYPLTSRSEEQKQKCIKSFLRGLSSRDVTSAVLRGEPRTMEEAFRLAEKEHRFTTSLSQYTDQRLEVPMDISAVPPPKSIIEKQLEMITTKLAKLEARQDQVLPPRQGRRQQNRYHKPSSWTTDGRPVCYNCGYSGHISKDCRAPRRSTTGQTSRNQSHSKYHPSSQQKNTVAAVEPSTVYQAQDYQPYHLQNPFVPQPTQHQ